MPSEVVEPNCWKVIKYPSRRSAVIEGSLSLEYPQGVEVIAPVGGILAFSNIPDAEKAGGRARGWAIVPAVGREQMELPVYPASTFYDINLDLASAQLAWTLSPFTYNSWLPGTVAYKYLTCLE